MVSTLFRGFRLIGEIDKLENLVILVLFLILMIVEFNFIKDLSKKLLKRSCFLNHGFQIVNLSLSSI